MYIIIHKSSSNNKNNSKPLNANRGGDGDSVIASSSVLAAACCCRGARTSCIKTIKIKKKNKKTVNKYFSCSSSHDSHPLSLARTRTHTHTCARAAILYIIHPRELYMLLLLLLCGLRPANPIATFGPV